VAGLPDWKTEKPEVARWLLDAQIGWARRSGVDGFRLDTVKHVGHPFWREHRRRTRAELGPSFFLLGEVWGGDRDVLDPWFQDDELDAGFDFGFQGSALAWVRGRGRTVAFDRYLASREKVRPGHLLAHFLSSHDVPGALFQLGGDLALFRMAAALELTVSGIPVVYYGEEVGRPIGVWPDNRGDMPWGARPILPGQGLPRDEELRAFYQRLIAIRRAHPALLHGRHRALATEGDLYLFERAAEPGDAVIVALNRGAAAARAVVPAPAEWRDAPAADLLGSCPARRLPDGSLELEVASRTACVVGVPNGSGR
jgi:alpha-amylase